MAKFQKVVQEMNEYDYRGVFVTLEAREMLAERYNFSTNHKDVIETEGGVVYKLLNKKYGMHL